MDLHYISAVEAIKKFKDKSLSPVELVNSIIERSEKINPKINAHNFIYKNCYFLLKFSQIIVHVEIN